MARQLTRSAVRIYGALSALGDGSGNVMEGLLPFFDPILRQYNGSKLDPDVIASAIRDTYKWNFNADLVEAFVPYLERHDWIVADIPGNKDTTYTIKMSDVGQSEPSDKTVESELRNIAMQFKEFANALSPLTAIPRDVEEFEDILVEWLLYVEAFSEKSIDFKTDVRRAQSGTLRQFIEVPNTTSLRDEDKFLCARFVKHAIKEDQGSAEVLARIAAIGLLTEVVQDFVKPITAIDKTDLVVYLDAPVAMELLGVSGRSARENTAPIVVEMLRMGASVRIFGQSIAEISNSLQAVLKNPRPTGPTAQALMRREVLKEYVVEVARDPIPLLEALGVKATYRNLEQTPSEHQFFTKDNWQDLYSKLSYAEHPRARRHDTDVTTLVVRHRRGKTSRDIFKSHAIMLTRNGLLAQIVRRTCIDLGYLPVDAVSPIIHRRVLATAMWLRTGLGAGDLNIPKRMLLANCEHVLAIRPGVVEAVKRLTDAMGDEEKIRQLDLLVSQDRSAQALMDKTLGMTNVVTEENLPLLWQEMLHPHLEEERKKGLDAVDKAKAEGKRRLESAKEQIDAIAKKSDQQAATLQAKYREDREAVDALCSDVERSLCRRRKARMGIALAIALASCTPLMFETTSIVRVASVLIGWVFAYLTATGGKLIGIATSKEAALGALRSAGMKRRLVGKLDQFDVRWKETVFVVSDRGQSRSTTNRSDLFSGGDG
jgi:hypothetical protein